ncbi:MULTISPECIES: hypothetical protein [Streptococcus]|uniref:ORF4 n=1 Tax=Streptococcus suis TaxID=1307 RepID=Q9S5D8_STRSU|nr:hypothetical protein [Streptococcus suis]MCG9919534.1 hypothetical protein [Streptococcus suis]BAA83678.1 ORF4 [Streptococcus suis]HEM3417229.1 hypothetical protein [Streptococcus suis]
MSKTVSELSAELGVSKQYLNRVLSQNNLGRKIGNKKLVSDSDVKSLLSILKNNIGNQKSETENIVSDIPSKSTGKRDTGENGNQKSETSFRYLHEQLEIKGKEVERLHQLLDQSQQLLLNEQKKNQLLLEEKSEEYSDKGFHQNLIESMQGSLSWNRQEVSRLNEKLENSVSKKWFYVVVSVAVFLFVMLLVLVWGNF